MCQISTATKKQNQRMCFCLIKGIGNNVKSSYHFYSSSKVKSHCFVRDITLAQHSHMSAIYIAGYTLRVIQVKYPHWWITIDNPGFFTTVVVHPTASMNKETHTNLIVHLLKALDKTALLSQQLKLTCHNNLSTWHS